MDTENRVALASEMILVLKELSNKELLFLADNLQEVKDYITRRIAEIDRNTFVTPLSDKEVMNQFPQFADRLAPWRKLASSLDYYGPVVWLVKEGFNLKKYSLFVGPCTMSLDYLKDWDFKDIPTSNMLVFWVPRLAPDSTSKTVAKREQYRNKLRAYYDMPENHCDRFGSIALLVALILAHFKRTGERVPLKGFFVLSDTLTTKGYRFFCGGYSLWIGLLRCSDGLTKNDDDVGFFLLGVEEI